MTDKELAEHYKHLYSEVKKQKDYSNLVNELQCDRVESQKYIVRANKKLNQLQSNWNSLKEIIKDLGIYYLLDKMNKLEGNDKN